LLKVYPYEAIDIRKKVVGVFQVNGLRLKHYIDGEPIDGKVIYALPDASST